MLPRLSYYELEDSEKIHIPVMLISRDDGRKLDEAFFAATVAKLGNMNGGNNSSSNNSTGTPEAAVVIVSIHNAKHRNGGLTNVWNFYWIFFASTFGVCAVLSVVCVASAFRKDSKTNGINKLSLVITLISSLCRFSPFPPLLSPLSFLCSFSPFFSLLSLLGLLSPLYLSDLFLFAPSSVF